MVDPSFCMRKSVIIPPACRERFAPLEHPALAAWRRAEISFAGISHLVPGYRIANPRPERVMAIATVSGAGWAVTPTATQELRPGSLFVGPVGLPVGWGVDASTWRIVWWYMQPVARWRAWNGAAAITTPCPQAELLAALVDDVLDRLAGDDELPTLAATLALRHLDALAATPTAGPADDAERFAELWRDVSRHPQEDWSLPRLAERLGLSVSTVQRLARAQLGQAPHRALVGLRLAQARELLRSTSYPLATIAELAGYADQFTFSAAFRRWAGVPPSVMRTKR